MPVNEQGTEVQFYGLRILIIGFPVVALASSRLSRTERKVATASALPGGFVLVPEGAGLPHDQMAEPQGASLLSEYLGLCTATLQPLIRNITQQMQLTPDCT